MEPIGIRSTRILSRGVLLVELNLHEAKQRVTEGGLWLFEKKPLVVRGFNINESYNKDEMMRIPTWVRLPGLPLKILEYHRSK